MAPPRLRFCPAPSGWLHVGGARTALYNHLWARRTGGAFVVRIEDTDADRATQESADGMLAALRFLGLDWDEGPEVEGPYGPYRQSDRTALYAAVADLLLKAGHAYDAYETAEELEAARTRATAEGRPPGYDGAQRELTDAQRAAFLAEGRRPTLRLRTPDTGSVAFDDHVRGRVEFAWADVGDFVIARADGSPTYYLANTVDDLAMGITLIARGEDLLAATPRQRLLSDLLLSDGLLDAALAEAALPARPPSEAPVEYAHLPIIVGADRKKLSKRHGSVAIEEFRRQGFLPEVLVNFLALCGWGTDGARERFTPDELVEAFSFDRVGRNPALFDTDKLHSLNGDRIRELAAEPLAERLQPVLVDAGVISRPPAHGQARLLLGLVPLLQERIQTLADAVPLVAPLFAETVTFDEAAVAKHLKPPADRVLDQALTALRAVDPWVVEGIHAALDGVADRVGVGRGKAFQPVRVAVTGTAVSPPLPETLALLDREVVLARVEAARALVRDA